MVAAALLSALMAGLLAHFKSAKDMDVKVAVLDAKICALHDRHEEYKESTTDSIAAIAADMKAAARELLVAASTIQSLSQTQAVVNTVSTKLLDSLATKVESQGVAIAELKGVVSSLRDNNNHGTRQKV